MVRWHLYCCLISKFYQMEKFFKGTEEQKRRAVARTPWHPNRDHLLDVEDAGGCLQRILIDIDEGDGTLRAADLVVHAPVIGLPVAIAVDLRKGRQLHLGSRNL